MLVDVIDVQPLNPYKLRLRFEDGVTGVVDLKKLIDFTGIFKPLRDVKFCAKATVDPDIGTIIWPNGADIDPDVLYPLVIGEPIADLFTSSTEITEG